MGQITTWDEFPTVEYVPGVFRQTVSGEKAMLTRIVYRGGVVIPDHSHPAEQLMLVEQGRLWAKVGDEESEVGPGLAADHPLGLGPRLPPAGRRGRRLLRVLRADPARVPRRLQGPRRVAGDDAEGARGRPELSASAPLRRRWRPLSAEPESSSIIDQTRTDRRAKEHDGPARHLQPRGTRRPRPGRRRRHRVGARRGVRRRRGEGRRRGPDAGSARGRPSSASGPPARRASRSPPTRPTRPTRDRMVAETLERFGRIDILVNAVGGGAGKALHPAEAYPRARWDWIMELNVRSTIAADPGRGPGDDRGRATAAPSSTSRRSAPTSASTPATRPTSRRRARSAR